VQSEIDSETADGVLGSSAGKDGYKSLIQTEYQPEASAWTLSERVRILSTAPLFGALPPEAVRYAADVSHLRTVRRRDFVFLEGEPAQCLDVLVTGRVKIIRVTEDGHEVIMRIIGPGEMFGIVGIGAVPVYRASALAQEESRVLQIPTAKFLSLADASSACAKETIRMLAALLLDAEARICDLQTKDAERRIARTLLQLAAGESAPSSGGTPVSVMLTRQDLADLAGTTVGTVSRTISAWVRSGIISAGRERIVALDFPVLQEIAQGYSDIWTERDAERRSLATENL
jgi:CRP-like cAMP-binding protein